MIWGGRVLVERRLCRAGVRYRQIGRQANRVPVRKASEFLKTKRGHRQRSFLPVPLRLLELGGFLKTRRLLDRQAHGPVR